MNDKQPLWKYGFWCSAYYMVSALQFSGAQNSIRLFYRSPETVNQTTPKTKLQQYLWRVVSGELYVSCYSKIIKIYCFLSFDLKFKTDPNL